MNSWPWFLGDAAVMALMVGAAGFAAVRVASRLLPASADLLERVSLAGVIGVVGWVVLLQVLGLLGVLWLPVVVTCLVLLAAACVALLPPTALPGRERTPLGWQGLALLLPLATLAVVEVFSSPPTLFSFDSLHYHIVNAAQILNSGSIRSLPFAQPGDGLGAEPGNGSLTLLIAMLPFHNASLVGLVDLGCSALLVAVMGILLRETGRSAWAGVIAGLVVVSTWSFFATQIQSAYSDVVGLVGLVGAVAFALRSSRTREVRWLALSGMCLGLAMGTKLTDVLPAVTIAAVILVAERSARRPGWAGTFLLAAIGLCAAWYLRNWVDASDPIFPQTVRLGSWVVFPGLSGSASVFSGADQSVIDGIAAGRVTSVGQWLSFGVRDLGAALAAIPLGMVLMASRRRTTRLLAVLTAACVAAYLVTPYSGSIEASQLDASMRFLLPAVAFGAAAAASGLPEHPLRLLAGLALGIDGLVVATLEARDNGAVPVLVAVGLTMAVLALLHWRNPLLSRMRSPGARRAVLVGVLALLVLDAAHLQPAGGDTTVGRLVDLTGAPDAPVVLLDVADVAAILGPQLDIHLVAAGDGPQGAERPIWNAGALTARIESLHPAAVVIGDETIWNVIPAGWTPPKSWHLVGTQGGALVYRPDP
jgi:hypothetical protein